MQVMRQALNDSPSEGEGVPAVKECLTAADWPLRFEADDYLGAIRYLEALSDEEGQSQGFADRIWSISQMLGWADPFTAPRGGMPLARNILGLDEALMTIPEGLDVSFAFRGTSCRAMLLDKTGAVLASADVEGEISDQLAARAICLALLRQCASPRRGKAV